MKVESLRLNSNRTMGLAPIAREALLRAVKHEERLRPTPRTHSTGERAEAINRESQARLIRQLAHDIEQQRLRNAFDGPGPRGFQTRRARAVRVTFMDQESDAPASPPRRPLRRGPLNFG